MECESQAALILIKDGVPCREVDSVVRMSPALGCSTRFVSRVARLRSFSRGGRKRAVGKWRLLLLMLGWVLATGAHWDLIQVAAWGQMWARNAQVQPLGLALATTLSPEGMCSVCKTVQAAKLEQADNPVLDSRTAPKAPLLLPLLGTIVVEHPAPVGALTLSEPPPLGCSRAAPPVPPPRTDIAIA